MKLHQLLAFEKSVRQRSTEGITELHRQTQLAPMLMGTHKKYQPREDEGTQFPDEISPVTLRYNDAIDEFKSLWAESVDLEAKKDFTNQNARASVVIDGETLLSDVPATHLLFLEKQLENVRTFVSKMVELPPGTDWTFQSNSGLHVSPEKLTFRTEKVEEALLLAPATDKHPAQAEKITRDRVVGEWRTINSHGGIPLMRKRVILRQLATLLQAVKAAREEANTAEVVETALTSWPLLDYIFNTD